MKKISTVPGEPIKLLLLFVVVLAVGMFLGRQNVRIGGDTISPAQLKRMLAKKNPASPAGGFTFINVHTPYEGEIEKTDAFIAFDKIVEQSAFLPKDKNAPIILYCKTGRMSEEAIQTVRKLGYTNVKHLAGGMEGWQKSGGTLLDLSKISEAVLPQQGFELPVAWGDLGKKLVDNGVLDIAKFRKIIKLTADQEQMLTKGSAEHIKINAYNSQFIVDMLWALGLAQKSIVYTDGPLGKEYANKQDNFASTGGWTLGQGKATEYLNRFDFVPLTAEQQQKVGEIAKNIYRPCCDNPTWFPDCNHGMAALAIIELLVSQGIADKDIYRYVLGFNSFWFPETYITTATFFARQGVAWNKIDVKEILGKKFSSGSGAADIAKKVGPLPYLPQSGGSCGT